MMRGGDRKGRRDSRNSINFGLHTFIAAALYPHVSMFCFWRFPGFSYRGHEHTIQKLYSAVVLYALNI